MKRNNTILAFTLIELMVVITIIGVLVGFGSQINFNRIGEENKAIIFNNSLVSQYETIRNNSLLGKGVGTNIGVPDAWRLEYTNSGSGAVNISYSSGGWINIPSLGITANNSHSISNIDCMSATGAILNTNVNSAMVEIKGNEISLGGDCNIHSKKLNFTTQLKNSTHEIEINTLNGLIEIK